MARKSQYAGHTWATAGSYRIQRLSKQLRAGTARIITTCAAVDPRIGPYWVINDMDNQCVWHIPLWLKPRWGRLYGIHESDGVTA
jgi:hypothetical protein